MAEDDTISKDTHLKRLKAKQDALDALEERYGTLRTEHEALKATAAETPDYAKLEKRYNRLTEKHDSLTGEFATHKANATNREAMLGAGVIDEDDQALVRWAWERIPEAGRPALVDFLGESGAAREDRHLKTLFVKGEEEPAKTDQKPAQGAQGDQRRGSRMPPTQGGTQPQGAPPKSLSREAILAMPASERVKPENREAIWNSLNNV